MTSLDCKPCSTPRQNDADRMPPPEHVRAVKPSAVVGSMLLLVILGRLVRLCRSRIASSSARNTPSLKSILFVAAAALLAVAGVTAECAIDAPSGLASFPSRL